MICPKCESEMEKIVFQTIEIDRCNSCKGIWFDSLEYEELKKIRNSERLDSGSPTEGKEFNKIDRINCPKCRTLMIKMVDKDQPNISYESCSVCYGAFYDAGEFKDSLNPCFFKRVKNFFFKG
ncbi:MAG: zf-TFIIB domain-containing protein [Desulfobacterales bacterium]|nr:zf-TFIIB domain-containing protein [Desulfobacterales bacterium]